MHGGAWRGNEVQGLACVDLQFHGSHNLHLINSPSHGQQWARVMISPCRIVQSAPQPSGTGAKGCHQLRLWHVQQPEPERPEATEPHSRSSLRMSQIVKAQFLYQSQQMLRNAPSRLRPGSGQQQEMSKIFCTLDK